MHRMTLATAAVAVVLLGAGCTTEVPGLPAPSTAAPESAAAAPGAAQTPDVAWTDAVCSAVLPVVKTLSSPPQANTSDPAAAVSGLSSYLDQASGTVDAAVKSLGAIEPSPIDGGDQAVTQITTALTSLRDTVRTARTKVAALATASPQSLATQLPAALAPLSKLAAVQDAAGQLQDDPALAAAATQAPQCQQLQAATR